LFGKAVFRRRPGSAWMRDLGAGVSKTDKKRFLVCECATAQAISHCLHPIQRSGCTKTVFMVAAPFSQPMLKNVAEKKVCPWFALSFLAGGSFRKSGNTFEV